MTDSKEREAFELFVLSKYPGASLSPRVNNCGIACDDSYANPRIDFAYEAWLARAKAVDVPKDLIMAAIEANEICRSAFHVAERVSTQYGTIYAGIDFGALCKQLSASLHRQNKVINPYRESVLGPKEPKL